MSALLWLVENEMALVSENGAAPFAGAALSSSCGHFMSKQAHQGTIFCKGSSVDSAAQAGSEHSA